MELAEVDDVTMETQSYSRNSVRNIAKLRDSDEVYLVFTVLSCKLITHVFQDNIFLTK